MTTENLQIEPTLVQEMLQKGNDFLLVDVREPQELALCCLPQAQAIPLRLLPENVEELPKDTLIIFMCHLGVRSMNAAVWARQQGLRAQSMRGGIEAWAVEVDRSVARY